LRPENVTDGPTRLAGRKQFEANRSHLWSIAYRMRGSLAEADDAKRAIVKLGWT
jgi:DNA-directed RNA polymerase specialized sigma24 family protein